MMIAKGIFKINTTIIAIARIKLHIILDFKSSTDKLFRWNEKQGENLTFTFFLPIKIKGKIVIRASFLYKSYNAYSMSKTIFDKIKLQKARLILTTKSKGISRFNCKLLTNKCNSIHKPQIGSINKKMISLRIITINKIYVSTRHK